MYQLIDHTRNQSKNIGVSRTNQEWRDSFLERDVNNVQILLHRLVLKVLLVDFDDYADDDGRGGMSTGRNNAQPAGGLSDIAVQDGSTVNTDDRARIIDQSARVLAKSDWRRLAVVIDRFFFVVFAVILILTCLAFSGYL